MNLRTFYKSSEWLKLMELLKLKRVSNGELICEYCGKPIVKKYDCIGHHKIELTESNVHDVTVSLNEDNIMLVHHVCHNKIHQRFEGFTRKVYLVYGPPCAGKSTWVNDVAYDDDLIVDIDKVWECICLCDKYHKPNRLKRNAFGLMDTLLDQVKTRNGMWRNAYVIGGYPLPMERQRVAERLGAELVYIDTDKDTCMSRALNDDWRKYIDEWFEVYQP